MLIEWWMITVLLFIPFLGIIAHFIWTDINLEKIEDENKKHFDYSIKKIHDLVAEISELQENIRILKIEIKYLKEKKE